MDVIFHPPAEVYSRVPAASIVPGHVFIDTNDIGDRTRVIALRGAKRLTSGKYRVYGLSVDKCTPLSYRLSGSAMVEIVGFCPRLGVTIPPLQRPNGLDQPYNDDSVMLRGTGPIDEFDGD